MDLLLLPVRLYIYFIQKILFIGCTFMANLGLIDAGLMPADAIDLLDIVGISGVIAGPIVTILVIYVLSRSGIIDLSTIFIRKEK